MKFFFQLSASLYLLLLDDFIRVCMRILLCVEVLLYEALTYLKHHPSVNVTPQVGGRKVSAYISLSSAWSYSSGFHIGIGSVGIQIPR